MGNLKEAIWPQPRDGRPRRGLEITWRRREKTVSNHNQVSLKKYNKKMVKVCMHESIREIY